MQDFDLKVGEAKLEWSGVAPGTLCHFLCSRPGGSDNRASGELRTLEDAFWSEHSQRSGIATFDASGTFRGCALSRKSTTALEDLVPLLVLIPVGAHYFIQKDVVWGNLVFESVHDLTTMPREQHTGLARVIGVKV